ncbi:DMT family transporter [Pseudomonadota bacterium]
MTQRTGDRPLFGVVLVLVGVAFLSTMDAAMKVLLDGGLGGGLGGGLAVVQILAVRSWLVVPVLTAWALTNGGIARLKTKQIKFHLARVVLGAGAPLFFFTSLKTLGLAEATTIAFGAMFLMTALSTVVLKERVGPHRWAGVALGFSGVVLAMQPTTQVFDVGALYALLAAVFYALFMLMTRKLGTGEGALKQVLYFHAWLGLVCTVAMIFDNRPLQSQEGMLIALVGALVVVAHLCLTRGFTLAPVGLLAPFEYTALIWAAVLGYLVFGDVPGVELVAGAGIIVAAGLYLIYRETRGAKKRTALPTAGPVAVPGVASLEANESLEANKSLEVNEKD